MTISRAALGVIECGATVLLHKIDANRRTMPQSYAQTYLVCPGDLVRIRSGMSVFGAGTTYLIGIVVSVENLDDVDRLGNARLVADTQQASVLWLGSPGEVYPLEYWERRHISSVIDVIDIPGGATS